MDINGHTPLYEDYVSFETAKLLKERGFDSNTNCYYIEDSVTRTLFYSPIEENHNASIKNNEFDIHINISSGKMSTPTLQMAMKWLRKKKGVAIIPVLSSILDNEKFLWDVKIVVAKTGERYSQGWVYEKQEDAFDTAIRYCLKNLI